MIWAGGSKECCTKYEVLFSVRVLVRALLLLYLVLLLLLYRTLPQQQATAQQHTSCCHVNLSVHKTLPFDHTYRFSLSLSCYRVYVMLAVGGGMCVSRVCVCFTTDDDALPLFSRGLFCSCLMLLLYHGIRYIPCYSYRSRD